MVVFKALEGLHPSYEMSPWFPKKHPVDGFLSIGQSDDELLKNSKYITDKAFWQNIFEKWDSSSLSHSGLHCRNSRQCQLQCHCIFLQDG